MPLANEIRPKKIEDIYGQKHLLGENKVISNIIKNKHMMNMIFYGPPGTGKTTLASIIAKEAGMHFVKLNATNDTMQELKAAIEETKTLMGREGVLLYIDEIHHFTKRTQQTLLEYIENGKVILIGSTTENPYFHIFKGVLSRCIVLEFKTLEMEDIKLGVDKAIEYLENENNLKVKIEDTAYEYIYNLSEGDLRRAINLIELIYYSMNKNKEIFIDTKVIEEISVKKSMNFDSNGDMHYALLSAFQKSIRGSDENAALYYLAILIKGGDLISICRRIMVIACEDISLAYPQAISIVKSCVDIAKEVGFPEAQIPLANAVILLATSPKSNSAVVAIQNALRDVENKTLGNIPDHLINNKYSKVPYKYPHAFANNYIKQQYMPNGMEDIIYYIHGDNKFENAIKDYQKKIKK